MSLRRASYTVIKNSRNRRRRFPQAFRDFEHSRLQTAPPPGISADEIRAHFQYMPARYWERVSESELFWGLSVVHRFLETVPNPHSSTVLPILEWKQNPEKELTEVMLCTWDRHGLLAKVAAAFCSVDIHVVELEAYTRADDLVLDVFRVREHDGGMVKDSSRLLDMLFHLEAALDPTHSAPRPTPAQPGVPHLLVDNDSCLEHTLLRIEAPYRLGLLSDVLTVLSESKINVVDAILDCDDDISTHVFYVNEMVGSKVNFEPRLNQLRMRLQSGTASKSFGTLVSGL